MTTTATRNPRPAAGPPMRQAPPAPARKAPAPAGPPPQQAGPTVVRTNLAALAGALAVIGGSTALSPLIEGYGWLLPLAELVAVVYLIGAGARLVGTPAWAVSLLQVAGFAIAFTGLHLHTGIGGVLPGRAALGEAGDLLTAAWSQIMTTVPPAPVTAELSMIISLLLGVIALVVDALIAGCHAPAMSALPLLGLYSVPAAIADDMLPWYAFVLPAVGYIAVLAASGAGKVHLSGRAATHVILVGCLITAVSVTGAVFGADAARSVGTEGRLTVHGHSGEVGLSPWALLRGQLTDGEATDMMTVSGIDQPGYLRAFALEQWTPNEGFGPGPLDASDSDVDGPLPDGSGFTPRDIAAADTTTATITPSHYRDKYLPIYLDSVAVGGLPSGWDYDSALRTVFRSGKTTPDPYQVTVPTTPATADQLRTEPVVAMPELLDTTGVPDSVSTLARSVIDKAGATTVFEAADALLHYFTNPANGFRYSLTVPAGNTGDALTDFLTQKTGYCEQYAAALAVMLRSIGVPARVGIGFTQGERQPDGSYLIESTNAHAWVEVPFQDSGWIIFDPTPAVDGQGGLQGFVTNSGTPGGGPSVTTTASTTPTGSSSPTTSRSLEGANLNQGAQLPDEDIGSVPKTTAKTGFLARFGVPLLIALGAVLLLVLVLVGPRTVRRWRRRRRLAAVTAGRDAAATAWLEITDTMRDHGLTVNDADSARTTANTLALATRLSTQERTDLKDIVTAAEARWYGEAPDAGSSGGSRDGGRDVRGRGGTAHDAAPGDFARGVRGVVGALARTKPVSGLRRWWPASLRRY